MDAGACAFLELDIVPAGVDISADMVDGESMGECVIGLPSQLNGSGAGLKYLLHELADHDVLPEIITLDVELEEARIETCGDPSRLPCFSAAADLDGLEQMIVCREASGVIEDSASLPLEDPLGVAGLADKDIRDLLSRLIAHAKYSPQGCDNVGVQKVVIICEPGAMSEVLEMHMPVELPEVLICHSADWAEVKHDGAIPGLGIPLVPSAAVGNGD